MSTSCGSRGGSGKPRCSARTSSCTAGSNPARLVEHPDSRHGRERRLRLVATPDSLPRQCRLPARRRRDATGDELESDAARRRSGEGRRARARASQPMPGFAEQVYWHDVKPDPRGWQWRRSSTTASRRCRETRAVSALPEGAAAVAVRVEDDGRGNVRPWRRAVRTRSGTVARSSGRRGACRASRRASRSATISRSASRPGRARRARRGRRASASRRRPSRSRRP